jgi:multiple sugar transport system permease protein
MTATTARTVPPPGRRFGFLRRLGGWGYIGAFLLALLFISPLVWSAVTSVKPPGEAVTAPMALPSEISTANYDRLRDYGAGITTYVANSIFVSGIAVIGTLIIGTMAGYGFSRFDFRFKNALFIVILATLMIPFQALMIPLFIVLRQLGLTNDLFGLAMVYIMFQLPFSVFVMRNSFDRVPRELEEAAIVDGAGQIRLLVGVMAPMVLPGIVTIGLFAFLLAWNEFFAALILLTHQDTFTLPILLLSARQGLWNTVEWGSLQAGVVITMIPCLIFYFLLQRFYVSGLQSGAVKA